MAIFAVFFGLVILGCSDVGTEPASNETVVEISEVASEEIQEEVTSEYVPTTGERNALGSAEAYFSFATFSYESLIEQLEVDGYTHEEAVYAADHCGADWNEQAAASAKVYLSIMPFSKEALIEQLEIEGFTHEQAVYGAEANGY